MLKAEDKITKARTAIMRDPRFVAMSGVLMVSLIANCFQLIVSG